MKTFARREATRLLSQSNAHSRAHIPTPQRANFCIQGQKRGFHDSRRLLVVKPYLLADIGEGEDAQWLHRLHMANVVNRYHRMSSHPMVCEAGCARRTVRSNMRSTVGQGICGGKNVMMFGKRHGAHVCVDHLAV
jgi:hypothetical protein